MTNTNQASEELREAVRDGLANHTGEFVNPWIFRNNYSHEELTDMLDDIMAGERLFKNLQALIRTEKLKLLAEIRERVVGEDERIDIQSEFDKIDVPHLETDKYPGLDGVRQASRNIYRNHQRAELTKLEAEL